MNPVKFPNNATWEDLAAFIASMPPEDRRGHISVQIDGDDFLPVSAIGIAKDDENNPAAGVLDEGHPFLVLA